MLKKEEKVALTQGLLIDNFVIQLEYVQINFTIKIVRKK